MLSRQVDDHVSWNVSVVVDPLTGTDREAPEILDACHERLQQEGWDLADCLTDLPVYRSGRMVVADVSAQRKVASLSLPALGATRLLPRARKATLQLVSELYTRSPELGQDYPSPNGEERDAAADDAADAGTSGLPGQRPHNLVGRRLTERAAPFRRVEPPDEDMKDMNVDARFAAPGARGHLRLWAGMVLANRPWKLFSSFKGAIAAAFATAAYVLVIPTIWTVADAVGWARLQALMVAAIVAMVVWIIVGHHLWERPDDREARHGHEVVQPRDRADHNRGGAARLRRAVRPRSAGGGCLRAEPLLPIDPPAPGRSRHLRDPGLDGDLAGHGRGRPGGEPGTRGYRARGHVRLPAAAPPERERLRRERLRRLA